MDEHPWRSEDGKLWLDVSCLRAVFTGWTSESLFDSFHRLFHELHFRSRNGLYLFFHAFRVISIETVPKGILGTSLLRCLPL